jgi:hypothetical protein
MHRAIVAAALMALSISTPTYAQTALEVESQCRGFATAAVYADGRVQFPAGGEFCWGAFTSIQQLSRLTMVDVPLLRFCAPTDSTRLQFIKVFLAYSQRHPEKSHLDFGMTALQALIEAFPCR